MARLIPLERFHSCVLLSEAHQRHVFGASASMHIASPRVAMKGQYLYQETLRVVSGKKAGLTLPVAGPFWEETRVELTPSDAKTLGDGSLLTLQGPEGVVKLTGGFGVAPSRLYCSPEDAKALDVVQGQRVELCLADQPTTIFSDVEVRVHPTYTTTFILNEGNATTKGVLSGVFVQRLLSA